MLGRPPIEIPAWTVASMRSSWQIACRVCVVPQLPSPPQNARSGHEPCLVGLLPSQQPLDRNRTGFASFRAQVVNGMSVKDACDKLELHCCSRRSKRTLRKRAKVKEPLKRGARARRDKKASPARSSPAYAAAAAATLGVRDAFRHVHTDAHEYTRVVYNRVLPRIDDR